MLAINGLNVVNSYVGRDFMTAIEQRSMRGFVSKALLYVGRVRGLDGRSRCCYRFSEERLGLLWREWLTRAAARPLPRRAARYYRLRERGEIDNPDQRIADDVRAFTTTTLSFVLMLLNGTLHDHGVLGRALVDQPAALRGGGRLRGGRARCSRSCSGGRWSGSTTPSPTGGELPRRPGARARERRVDGAAAARGPRCARACCGAWTSWSRTCGASSP